MSSAGSMPQKRRGSQSEFVLAEIDQPAGFGSMLIKHGKYVAAGLAGIWWFDMPAAVRQIKGVEGWAQ